MSHFIAATHSLGHFAHSYRVRMLARLTLVASHGAYLLTLNTGCHHEIVLVAESLAIACVMFDAMLHGSE